MGELVMTSLVHQPNLLHNLQRLHLWLVEVSLRDESQLAF